MVAAVADLERSHGVLRLRFRSRASRTVLDRVYQQGCSRARFPESAPTGWCEAIMMNTAGGLTGGDRLQCDIECSDGAHVVVTTQAAERIYRSLHGVADIRSRLRIAGSAALVWLPQETILFDGGRVARRTDIDMEPEASLFAVESLVFGRHAMGETVRSGSAGDRWRLRIGDQLVFADHSRFDDGLTSLSGLLAGAATAAGALAVATILCTGRYSDPKALRTAFEPLDVVAGVSAPGPVTVARVVARSAQTLRDAIARGFAAASTGFALPRVWQC